LAQFSFDGYMPVMKSNLAHLHRRHAAASITGKVVSASDLRVR